MHFSAKPQGKPDRKGVVQTEEEEEENRQPKTKKGYITVFSSITVFSLKFTIEALLLFSSFVFLSCFLSNIKSVLLVVVIASKVNAAFSATGLLVFLFSFLWPVFL